MIHFICAMKCEARPLLDRFKLQPYPDATCYPLFLNREGTASLTITGTGKLAAAAATMYAISQLNADSSDAWLNVGIAGHKNHAVGQAFLINRIEDLASGMRWYPQILFPNPLPTAGMETLDKPSTLYNDRLYEMEGAGFYASAMRLGSSELIHCLKIVSDNQVVAVERLSEKIVTQLVAAKIESIMTIAGELDGLSNRLRAIKRQSPWLEQLLKRWHFTQYQQYTLQQLLNRWHLLKPRDNPLEMDWRGVEDAGALLTAMEQLLDDVPIRFGEPHI